MTLRRGLHLAGRQAGPSARETSMRASSICWALLSAIALAGCQSANPPVAQIAAASPTETTYKLGPGDKLRLITFGEERLSGEFTVNETGGVALPLIGEIRAGGLTLDQFSQAIQVALANGFLKNPRVSVEVLNYRPFYILGEVAKPGEYPFINGLTVHQCCGYRWRLYIPSKHQASVCPWAERN